MTLAPTPVSFVHKLIVTNYRSIAACELSLGPLTYLVGPNGSGKSNVLDALRLISDSLNQSLDHALRDRGGIAEVRRRSSGHPTHFAIRVEFALPKVGVGSFAFKVAARKGGAFVVQREECHIGAAHYRVEEGRVVIPPSEVAPPAADDRLYLLNAAGLPAFRPVFEALSSMGFYSLNPDSIRALQTPDKGDLLKRDGSNLASVLNRLDRAPSAGIKHRIEQYLGKVVPGLVGVHHARVGHMEAVEFRQQVEGAEEPWRFPAINMSDGTLRALGTLVALFQEREHGALPLVGIEEPEAALHPAAAGILRDCLREASQRTQVVVTSHSPELLDDPSISPEMVLAVVAEGGKTLVGPVDEPTRSSLRDRLFTPGELLRADQLRPDPTSRVEVSQLGLFDGVKG
jgi:predicted ATPase